MKEKRSYIGGLMHGIGTLLTGMKITGREFFTKKVTEQYPENRATLEISPRFRGRLIMPTDAEGNNKCIACGLCQMACPNDTIHITSESVLNEETGEIIDNKISDEDYEIDFGMSPDIEFVDDEMPNPYSADEIPNPYSDNED